MSDSIRVFEETKTAIQDCMSEIDNLSNWEADFLKRTSADFSIKKELTDSQHSKLFEIYNRIQEKFAENEAFSKFD